MNSTRLRTTEGPEITVVRSCFTCIHMHGAPGYAGIGVRVLCTDADVGESREIGWSSWKTPDWCPVLARAVTLGEEGLREVDRLFKQHEDRTGTRLIDAIGTRIKQDEPKGTK